MKSWVPVLLKLETQLWNCMRFVSLYSVRAACVTHTATETRPPAFASWVPDRKHYGPWADKRSTGSEVLKNKLSCYLSTYKLCVRTGPTCFPPASINLAGTSYCAPRQIIRGTSMCICPTQVMVFLSDATVYKPIWIGKLQWDGGISM